LGGGINVVSGLTDRTTLDTRGSGGSPGRTLGSGSGVLRTGISDVHVISTGTSGTNSSTGTGITIGTTSNGSA